MGYAKLPPGVLAFIQENAPGRSNAELAQMTNAALGTAFNAKSIKAYKANHGIRSGIKPKPPSVFTPQIREFILKHHEGIRHSEMARMVNAHFGTDIPEEKLRWFYQNNKLRSGVRCSGNEAPPGTMSNRKGYRYIKQEDGQWVLLHHAIWEQAHGSIPEGHTVIFLDGNTENVQPSNLALVTRQEQMHLSKDGLRFDDAALTTTGILIAKVKVAASRHRKGGKADEPGSE